MFTFHTKGNSLPFSNFLDRNMRILMHSLLHILLHILVYIYIKAHLFRRLSQLNKKSNPIDGIESFVCALPCASQQLMFLLPLFHLPLSLLLSLLPLLYIKLVIIVKRLKGILIKNYIYLI